MGKRLSDKKYFKNEKNSDSFLLEANEINLKSPVSIEKHVEQCLTCIPTLETWLHFPTPKCVSTLITQDN